MCVFNVERMTTWVFSWKLTTSAESALYKFKSKVGNNFLTEKHNEITASGHVLRNGRASSLALKYATGAKAKSFSG